MTMSNRCVRRAFVASLAFAATQAMAVVLTFDTLPGANGDPFGGHTEAEGFEVATVAGDLCVGTFFGNPVPSLFGGTACGSASGTIEVSHGGGLFSFAAVDLAANNGAADYSFVGKKLGATVFSQAGVVAGRFGPFGFDTVPNVDASLIDFLLISLTGFGTSYNIDNIDVTLAAVPEPSTYALLALGVAALGIAARRRPIQA